MKRIGIKNALAAKIMTMSPNEKLASRKAMCMRYGAARATIDKVIRELVQEGLVYTIKGGGTFVSPNNNKSTGNMKGREHTWALLIPDIYSEIYPEMYAGLDDYADKENIALVICNTNDDPVREYSYIQTLAASNVSGMIIVPALNGGHDMKGYRYLMNCNIPFVFWNRSFDYMPNIPQVCLNGYQGGRIAVNHFLEKGYRRIAYISLTRFRSSMDRFFGYCSALNDANIEVADKYIRLEIENAHGQASDAVAKVVSDMLCLPEPPDAILCFTDQIAISAARAIMNRGLRVSDDIGLIGFESAVPIPRNMLGFDLTYVSLNSYESGRCAAETLKRIASGKNDVPLVRVFHPKLIIKNSCLGKNAE